MLDKVGDVDAIGLEFGATGLGFGAMGLGFGAIGLGFGAMGHGCQRRVRGSAPVCYFGIPR